MFTEFNGVPATKLVAEATIAPRFHHQWLPDQLRIERGLSPDTIRILTTRGHKVRVAPAIGSTQTVMLSRGVFYGSSDPRRGGALTLGLPARSPDAP